MSDKTPRIVPAVQMPSADLINFRFDQNDKNVAELKDMVGKLTNNFITKEEAQMLKEERDTAIAAVNKRLDNWQWYWRTIISGVVLALATAIAAIVIKK